MKSTRLAISALALVMGMSAGGAAFAAKAAKEPPKLTEAEFEKAKTLYFQRCAGCHGVSGWRASSSLAPKAE